MIAVLIPARGGSKGIPKKNLSMLGETSLLARAIQTARQAELPVEVFVSTDDDEIADVSEQEGATAIARPDVLCTDESKTEHAMLHFCSEVRTVDIIVLMQVTAPFTIPQDVDGICEKVLNKGFDSAVSVCTAHGGWLCGGFDWEFEGDSGKPLYDLKDRPMRQDMASKYRENGALYATTRDALLESECRVSGRIGLYVMPGDRSFEIDDPMDLLQAQRYLR